MNWRLTGCILFFFVPFFFNDQGVEREGSYRDVFLYYFFRNIVLEKG